MNWPLVFPRKDKIILEVAGDDAKSWVHGQVTNDVNMMNTGDARYALIVNVKARILADVWIIDRGDVLWLILPVDSLEKVKAQFDSQIIMEDVSLKERNDLALVSVIGPNAELTINELPEGVDVYACDDLWNGGKYMIAPHPMLVQPILEIAAQRLGGGLIDERTFEQRRQVLHVPRYGKDFGEANYPQETGLTPVAVSFNKGCYLGQEVICMIEARGKPPKRLVSFILDDGPEPSTVQLTSIEQPLPLMHNGDHVGELTSCAMGHDLIWRGMGYIKRALAEKGTRVQAAAAMLRVENVINVGADGERGEHN